MPSSSYAAPAILDPTGGRLSRSVSSVVAASSQMLPPYCTTRDSLGGGQYVRGDGQDAHPNPARPLGGSVYREQPGLPRRRGQALRLLLILAGVPYRFATVDEAEALRQTLAETPGPTALVVTLSDPPPGAPNSQPLTAIGGPPAYPDERVTLYRVPTLSQ